MTELPPDLADLVAAERAAPGPSDEARRRIHMKVAVTLGIAAAGTAVTASSATAATASTGAAATGVVASGIVGKIVAVVLVAGVLGGGAAAVIASRSRAAPEPQVTAPVAAAPELRSAPAPDPETVPAREATVAAPSVVVPSAAASTPTRVTRMKSRAPRVEPPASPPRVSEGARLAQAWTALGKGQPATVLALLDDDVATNPISSLAEERDALRIEALLQLSRRDEARELALAFRAHYPSSVHADLVARAMTKTPSPRQ